MLEIEFVAFSVRSKLGEIEGGSPGLVVMGEDWYSKGCEIKSQHRILDGHFFTLICCNISMVCSKRLKINKKEAEDDPFFKKSWGTFWFSLKRFLILTTVTSKNLSRFLASQISAKIFNNFVGFSREMENIEHTSFGDLVSS